MDKQKDQMQEKNFKILFEELGLDNLSEDKKLQLMMKWGDIVQKSIIIRVIQELPEEDKEEMDQLLAREKIDAQEVYDFLDKKLPNLEEITREEINKFRDKIIESAKSLGI